MSAIGRRCALALLWFWLCGAGVALAQISVQRKAPAGFETREARSVHQTLHVDGLPQPGISLAVSFQATPDVQGGDTAAVLPRSRKPLVELLKLLGVHPRAAKAWVEQEELDLGSSSCLPLLESADCVPVSLTLGVERRLALQLGERQTHDPASQGELSLLGSVYSSASWVPQARGNAGARMGLSTQGLLSSRQHYLEYDLLASNARQTQGITPNLLMAGTRLASGAAAHAGLFRAGGIGGEASAMQFFVRPRLLGVALRSDGRMLQAGETARVRFTLLAPARVTISSNGVQLYSGLLGLGEQVVALPGRPGNFVDVRTEALGGEQQTFQASVFGSDASAEGAAAWRWELGQTVAENGSAFGRHNASLLMTAARTMPLPGFAWQAAVQVGSSGAARLGLSASSRQGRWGAAAAIGHRGESGLSGFASTRLASLFDAGFNVARYRAPSWGGLPGESPCVTDRTLCYSNRSHSRAGLYVGLVDLPINLSLNASRSGAFSSRQLLLRTSIPFHLWTHRTRLQFGVRQMFPSGDWAVFAFLNLSLGASGTVVNSNLSVQGDGRSHLSTSYSHRLDDVWGAPASISQSVSGGTSGSSSPPPSFHHHFSGQLGSVVTHLSASHGGMGAAHFNASATAHYGLSHGRLAFTRYLPEFGSPSLVPSTMAAVKIVNDSMDDQTFLMGMRTIAVPPRASLLIPAPVGYSPDVRVAPGPVEDAQRLAMPTYLHAGNIREIRVSNGGWQRVRFMGPSPDGADVRALRTTHVRNSLDGAEERIYQDAQGYAFVFEPAARDTRVRYLDVHTSRDTARYRCQAEPPAQSLTPGIYPEVDFQCEVLPH